MRVREFISETWWEGLPDSFLAMMGYGPEPEAVDDDPNRAVKAAVREITRQSKR